MITHIALPTAANFAAHSAYIKLRDRASYAFALVSVAAMLDIAGDGWVTAARIAIGGVAHKPWRDMKAEALLVGRPSQAVSSRRLTGCCKAPGRTVQGQAAMPSRS